MRKHSMRASRIKAWLLALALIATAVPVYGAEPEYEEVTVSEDAAADEYEASDDAPTEDLRTDETVSENVVAEDAPTYQLTYDTLPDGTVSINGFTGEAGGDLIIPDEIDGKKVTAIGNDAFKLCNGFTGKLVLPGGLTTIGARAFYSCRGLNGGLMLPEGLTTIGGHAFSNCTGFTGDLVLPEGLTTIGTDAFSQCSGFTGDLVIPKGLTSIEKYAFNGCSGFTGDLVLPKNLTSIGDGAFMDCSGFTGIPVLPEGLTTIGHYAFTGCGGFTGNLVLPEGLTIIGGFAFYGCSGFNGKLVIPDSVTSIGSEAFTDCRCFRTVTNRSGVSIPLGGRDTSFRDVTWIDAATGEEITSIANGTAIRSDAYGFSNEDNFTHSTVPDAVYTGKKIMPDITVYHGRNTLRKNKDYKITFSNNINTGTATFTITGKGMYKGTATDTFNILEKDIMEDDVKISDIPMVRESGKNYTPVPSVTYNRKKLKKGIDFTIKYYRDGNMTVPVTPKAAGNYIAHIEGINNFKGIKDLSFEITPVAKIPVRNLTVAKIPA